MSRIVNCVKLGTPAEGLEKPPFRARSASASSNQVSAQAWRSWLEHSKMLINEYRLDLVSEVGPAKSG